MTRERWMTGYYRVRRDTKIEGMAIEEFAGIRKHDDGKWYVEIRMTESGSMLRYAGIWNTLKEATEEANFQLMSHEERTEYMGY